MPVCLSWSVVVQNNEEFDTNLMCHCLNPLSFLCTAVGGNYIATINDGFSATMLQLYSLLVTRLQWIIILQLLAMGAVYW